MYEEFLHCLSLSFAFSTVVLHSNNSSLSTTFRKKYFEDCLGQFYTKFQIPEKYELSSKIDFKSSILGKSDVYKTESKQDIMNAFLF